MTLFQLVRCQKSLPVFFGHGSMDPLVPLHVGQMSYDMLRTKMNFDRTEFKQYNGLGHSSSDEVSRFVSSQSFSFFILCNSYCRN